MKISNSALETWGKILGVILVYLVLRYGLQYYNTVPLEPAKVEMSESAGAEAGAEQPDANTEPITTTEVISETAPMSDTTSISDTTSLGEGEPISTTESITESGTLSATETITETAPISETTTGG